MRTPRWAGVLVLTLCATVLGVLPPVAAVGAPTPVAGDALVRLVRSGGFAGAVDRVWVAADGRVRVRRDSGRADAFSLGPRQLAHLRTTLRAADLDRLAHHYPAPGADMYVYAVTSGGVTVTATETAGPVRLRRLITLLAGYLVPRE